MSGFEEFHFLRPLWLLALVPCLFLWWQALRRRLGPRSWENVCDPALVPFILSPGSVARRRWPAHLPGVAAVLAILALAGPAWKRLPEPVFTSGGALVIALDLSRSMDAADITPTRLERARYKIADILRLRPEGQTALIAWAGDAFTVTPLTDDTATIASQLGALSTGIMPVQGSRADRALELAAELVEQAGVNRADVLLITDEAGEERDLEAAEKLKLKGMTVSVLGVGTAHGAPVPLADGGFLKDRSGEIVIPVLDEAPLRALAAAGDGIYARLALDDSDLAKLDDVLQRDPRTEDLAETGFRADRWREEGPWLVVLLLPLAALAFRRGYLLVLPLLFLLPPHQAQAFEWEDLWLRKDQQGLRALREGDAERAARLFRDPAWQGAARYRAEDFDGAAEALDRAQDTESLYNRGNALARAGRLEEAVEAWEEVLRREPGHEDARYNKELVEKELERQRQQQQGRQQQQQQDQGEDQGQDQGQDGSRQTPGQGRNEEPGEGQGEGERLPGEEGEDEAGSDRGAGEETPPEGRQPGDSEGEEKAGQSPPAARPGEGRDAPARAAGTDEPVDEAEQATAQWLRRIPDDPGGLLRRKFLYQYRQRSRPDVEDEKTW